MMPIAAVDGMGTFRPSHPFLWISWATLTRSLDKFDTISFSITCTLGYEALPLLTRSMSLLGLAEKGLFAAWG